MVYRSRHKHTLPLDLQTIWQCQKKKKTLTSNKYTESTGYLYDKKYSIFLHIIDKASMLVTLSKCEFKTIKAFYQDEKGSHRCQIAHQN